MGKTVYYSECEKADNSFRKHCKEECISYCVMNFIAWLLDTIEGRLLAEKIVNASFITDDLEKVNWRTLIKKEE